MMKNVALLSGPTYNGMRLELRKKMPKKIIYKSHLYKPWLVANGLPHDEAIEKEII